MRKLEGSIISAVTGWSAGQAIAVSFFIWKGFHYPLSRERGEWLFMLFFAAISAIFVFPVWAVVFLPLYLFIPAHSILWRWPVCTACGILAGPVLIWGWHCVFEPQASGAFPFLFLASVIGGVTCFTASTTRPRFFHDEKT
jgi:hypothetical protein